MPRIKLNMGRPTIDKAKYRRELKEALAVQLFRAWEAWITAFLEIVPVWTGESVGSIRPLANIVGIDVATTPSPTAPGDRSGLGGSQSSAQVKVTPERATITYRTSIPHLIVNEYIDATVFGFKLLNPGPYNFQGHALTAFLGVAAQAVIPIPTINFKVRASNG